MPRLIAGFARRYTFDRHGRRITSYLTEPAPTRSAFLLVYIQGSGCHSLFRAVENGRVSTRQQGLLAAVARDQAAVLAVEKPGVRFLDDPGPEGHASNCRPAFRREHTLDRWADAIASAVTAAADGYSRVVLVGHSEGAITAAAVARRCPLVSHVALLSGSGPSQLFDLLTAQYGSATELLDEYRMIQRRPREWRTSVWGHPHRRWSSFLETSTLDELLETSARVLIVHGRRDRVVPIAAARVLYAELIRRGHDVQLVERPAGHDLVRRGQSQEEGLREVFRQVVAWVTVGSGAA